MPEQPGWFENFTSWASPAVGNYYARKRQLADNALVANVAAGNGQFDPTQFNDPAQAAQEVKALQDFKLGQQAQQAVPVVSRFERNAADVPLDVRQGAAKFFQEQSADMDNPYVAKGIDDFAKQQRNIGLFKNVLTNPSAENVAEFKFANPEHFAADMRQASTALPQADTETPALRDFTVGLTKAFGESPDIGAFLKKSGELLATTKADPVKAAAQIENFTSKLQKENKEPESTESNYRKGLEGELKTKHPEWTPQKVQFEAAKQVRAENQKAATQKIQFSINQREAAKRAGQEFKMNINGLTPQENAALDRAIDNGLDPYKINSRTAKIYAQQEMRSPGKRWNELGAQAAFERNAGVMNTKALLNTIDPLLDSLERAGGALGNSRLPGWNKAKNYLKEMTGQADIVGFNNLRDDVVAEVERGLMGSGVLSDSKYQRAIKNINSAQSMEQLRAAIKNTRLVIRARLEALAKGPNPPKGGKAPSGGRYEIIGVK